MCHLMWNGLELISFPAQQPIHCNVLYTNLPKLLNMHYYTFHISFALNLDGGYATNLLRMVTHL